MKKYTIGLITGALLAISTMMFMGAQNKNLGDITAESIILVGGDGSKTIIVGGALETFNVDGKQTAYLGTGKEGFGFLKTYNADGLETAYLGTGEDGSGILTIQNMEGELIAGFGSSPDNGKDGVAFLLDRYGDIGWTASGKK